jgi:predicted RNA-binding protein
MRYWLCVANQENWEVIREKNIWGVEERHRNSISKVRPGDKLLVYVMGTKKDNELLPPRIVAAYEAVSEVFTDPSRLFKGKVYPLRIRLRPIVVFLRPLDFRELVPKLSFIKNKRMCLFFGRLCSLQFSPPSFVVKSYTKSFINGSTYNLCR